MSTERVADPFPLSYYTEKYTRYMMQSQFLLSHNGKHHSSSKINGHHQGEIITNSKICHRSLLTAKRRLNVGKVVMTRSNCRQFNLHQINQHQSSTYHVLRGTKHGDHCHPRFGLQHGSSSRIAMPKPAPPSTARLQLPWVDTT